MGLKDNLWAKTIFIALFFLGFIHQALFFGLPITAFEWPSFDMGLFFERFEVPNFLAGDFLTDAMASNNPRLVFGYQVVFLMKTLGINWHQAFLLLKSILVCLLPPLTFNYLVVAVQKMLKSKNTPEIIFFCFIGTIVIFFTKNLQYRLMIGDYLQHEVKSTPHSLSIFWALLGTAFYSTNTKVYTILLFLSTFTHPSVGLIFFILNSVFLEFWQSPKKTAIIFFITIFLPFLILILGFSSPHNIDLNEFIEIYIKNRLPHHYDFMSWDKTHIFKILISNSIIILGCGLFFKKTLKNIWMKSVIILIIYWSALMSQYFFIEIIPFKPIILIGPARLTAFSFIFILPFIISLLCIRYKTNKSLNLSFINPALVLIFFTTTVFAIYNFAEKNPLSKIKQKNLALFEWIEKNTTPEEIFVAPINNLAEEIPFVAKRKVFISQIFPFREDYYKEYHRRWQLIFGTEKDKSMEYYEGNGIERWRDILKNEKISYIIFKNKHNSIFNNFNPAYKDDNWIVFSSKSFF